jgi:hypothetical protein
MRKIVDWSGDTPLYLTGGRVWFEALRKNFLIGVRFGKLLELQDIQNNSFFSLGVRKGDCWRCSYVQYMRLMKHMYAVKNFFIHPIKQNVLHRIQPSKTFVHQCLACYRYRVMLRCKSPFVRTNQPALQRVWQPRKKSRAYSYIKAGPHMFFLQVSTWEPLQPLARLGCMRLQPLTRLGCMRCVRLWPEKRTDARISREERRAASACHRHAPFAGPVMGDRGQLSVGLIFSEHRGRLFRRADIELHMFHML